MAKKPRRSEWGTFYERTGRHGVYLRVTDPATGKRREFKAGADMKAARKFARRLRVAMEEARPTDPQLVARVDVDELAEAFLEHREKTRAESTVRREKTTVRNIVVPGFTRRWVDEITRLEVTRFLDGRMDEMGAGGRNRMASLLSALFKFAVTKGWALENVAAGIERMRETRRSFAWFDRSEQDALLAACDDRVRDLATVALETGMRKGELLALEWGAVHFDRGARGAVVVERSKNGKPRTIPLTTRAAAVLVRRKDARTIPLDGPDRVFWDGPKRSEHWGRVWQKRWKRGPEAIGRPEFRFHDLRHLFCANLAREGVPLADVAKLAGHSMAMAMRYADHCPENSSERAIERLERRKAGGA